jgi:hypothetical protein
MSANGRIKAQLTSRLKQFPAADNNRIAESPV